ncbi:MAG: UvrD-helicase domain-containing protein [Clostridia bacterium]|nr:UvrD-helicase domain-containing protein [Clostridia bacterium]
MTAYEEELKRSNAFDFDDLLVKTYEVLSTFPEEAEYYSNKFRYIHIDEFQDTNRIQYNIVKVLSMKYGNIFAVGDDDQSIYGWRGADINNILDFEKDFKGAHTYKLQRNYRSTKKILSLANAIISNNTRRKDKVLWTENDEGVTPEVYIADDEASEAQYTAIQIKRLLDRGYNYSDFVVLMRINALSRSYENAFNNYGIPCKVYGGFKFFERKEIKDLTAYLRILNNPLDNEAVLRVINVPKRGIGAKTIEVLLDYAEEKGYSLLDSIFDCELLDLSASAKSKVASFKEVVSKLIVDKENLSLTELVKAVIDKTDFLSCFNSGTSEDDDKIANVNELKNSVEEFERQNPDATLSEYLNSITLSSDTDEINDGNFVTLATIHSVKGLEYGCVFICGLDKDIFPIDRAYSDPDEMEEERRLMYVAITRAKERLYITRARSRYLYNSRRPTVQSGFLDELAPKLGITPSRRQSDGFGYGGSFAGNSRGDYYSYNSGRSRGGYGSRKNYDDYNDYGDYSDNSGYSGYKNTYGYSGVAGTKKDDSAFGFAGSFSGARQSPLPSAGVDLTKIKSGTKIKHKKFGEGTVIALKQSGADVVGDVAFKGIGIKSLVLKLAPIEIVE